MPTKKQLAALKKSIAAHVAEGFSPRSSIVGRFTEDLDEETYGEHEEAAVETEVVVPRHRDRTAPDVLILSVRGLAPRDLPEAGDAEPDAEEPTTRTTVVVEREVRLERPVGGPEPNRDILNVDGWELFHRLARRCSLCSPRKSRRSLARPSIEH